MAERSPPAAVTLGRRWWPGRATPRRSTADERDQESRDGAHRRGRGTGPRAAGRARSDRRARHASSIAAGASRCPGTRVPSWRDLANGSRSGTALPAGRVVGTAQSSRHAATGGATRHHSHRRIHRHDHLALARTGPLRRRHPDRGRRPAGPAAPTCVHGRMLSLGALAWSAAILLVGARTRTTRSASWSSASAPACSRSACCSCSGCCGAPGRSATGRIARAVLRVETVAPRPGDGVDLRRRASRVSDLTQPGWLAARPVLAAVDARHVLHRHPDRDRRPLARRLPLLADGRRELGRRHRARRSLIGRRARRPAGRRVPPGRRLRRARGAGGRTSAADRHLLAPRVPEDGPPGRSRAHVACPGRQTSTSSGASSSSKEVSVKTPGGSRHGSVSPAAAARSAAWTRAGVQGMSTWRTPRWESASTTAFWTAGRRADRRRLADPLDAELVVRRGRLGAVGLDRSSCRPPSASGSRRRSRSAACRRRRRRTPPTAPG